MVLWERLITLFFVGFWSAGLGEGFELWFMVLVFDFVDFFGVGDELSWGWLE